MPFDFQAAYDQLNSDDHDFRFYAALTQELRAENVLDLGCGTGTLARLLASTEHNVVGIDPDPHMLHVARSKPGPEKVDWRVGYSDSADPGWADLALMTGHVAQVFVAEESWKAVLQDLNRAVRAGGTLAFETRNPHARGWERWTREATLSVVSTDEGAVEHWHETVRVALPQVTYDTFTRNLASGDETCDRNVLAFRELDALGGSLLQAGFEVTSSFGNWSRVPVTRHSPEIIAIARRM